MSRRSCRCRSCRGAVVAPQMLRRSCRAGKSIIRSCRGAIVAPQLSRRKKYKPQLLRRSFPAAVFATPYHTGATVNILLWETFASFGEFLAFLKMFAIKNYEKLLWTVRCDFAKNLRYSVFFLWKNTLSTNNHKSAKLRSKWKNSRCVLKRRSRSTKPTLPFWNSLFLRRDMIFWKTAIFRFFENSPTSGTCTANMSKSFSKTPFLFCSTRLILHLDGRICPETISSPIWVFEKQHFSTF